MSLAELLTQREDAKRFWKLAYYDPHPKQTEFHHALGQNSILPASQRGLMAANRVGKSFCGAHETAFHLTGLYPDWWEGTRYNYPITAVCAGVTNDTTKAIIQKELLGDPDDPSALGTGAVPKHLIIDTIRKPGVPNAFQAFTVRHVTGGVSKSLLMAYEQDWKKFMGISAEVVWPDEEPPLEVWAQFLRMTTDKPDAIIYMTFTPEEGVTQVVDGFMNHLKDGQALITATWDDAPHLTEAKKKQILDALPEYQRDMRSKGIPLMGSGLVYPIKESDISYKITDIKLKPHWPRGCAMDLGKSDHPTAVVWMAWDRDLDIIYLYDCWKGRGIISENASQIRKRTKDYIPVFWPHDAEQKDPKSAKSYASLYGAERLNMWWESFKNPPRVGEKAGDIGVEAGIDVLLQRMIEGKFKVADHLKEWFEEFRMYHRKDGKIVALKDDLMSATRYCSQSHRNFRTNTMAFQRRDIEYSNKGIV